MPDRFRTGLVGLFDDRLQQAGCKVLVHLEPVDPLMQQAPCHHAGLVRRSHVYAIGVAAIFFVVRSIDNDARDEHARSLDSPGLQGFPLRDDPAGRVCRVVYGRNAEVEKKLRKEIERVDMRVDQAGECRQAVSLDDGCARGIGHAAPHANRSNS